MNLLDRLGALHGTDKSPIFNGAKFNRGWMTGHSYTPLYFELFRPLNVKRLLEIGIDQGNSLRMWRDFFPHARIVGVDINPGAMFCSDNIFTFQCDATDPVSLRKVFRSNADKFDIIIDDGSHDPGAQVKTANLLLPHVSEIGYYIIEDCTEAGVSALEAAFPERCSVIRFKSDFPTNDDCVCILHAPEKLKITSNGGSKANGRTDTRTDSSK